MNGERMLDSQKTPTRKAIDAFVGKRAKLWSDLRACLADYENHVADYYLRRGAYVAALNRARNALERYNGAAGNARSLRIMAAAYEELGMNDLAADTRRVLEANFPGDS